VPQPDDTLMKKKNKKSPHRGQPPGLPDQVKLCVRGILVLIDYSEGFVITPKGTSRMLTKYIGRYLLAEGFLVQDDDHPRAIC